MENFDQIFTLIAEHEEIRLNTNILETGLINIIALIAILIYTGQDFLGTLLDERRITIVKSVQDAEDKLAEAQKRLDEAKKQVSQTNIIVSEIKKNTHLTKKVLLETEANQTKKDLKTRFERGLNAFRSKERQIFLEIKQQIVTLVLKQTVSNARASLKPKDRATALISETIDKLEGDLL